jgi:hypothetical protein
VQTVFGTAFVQLELVFMTMMIDWNMQDLESFDEAYFGPPPRFLLEQKVSEPAPGDTDGLCEHEDGQSALDKLKSFFSIR